MMLSIQTIAQLWLLVFLSFFILMFLPQSCSTSLTGSGQVETIPAKVETSTRTSITMSVKRIIRIRGMVSGKTKKKKNRSMLKFKRRRNRKLRNELRYNLSQPYVKNAHEITRARKYNKSGFKNTVKTVKNMEYLNGVKSNTEKLSPKQTMKRMRSQESKKTRIETRPRKPTVSTTTTIKSTAITSSNTKTTNKSTNYSTMIQPKTSAEANYVALRRNIKVKKPKVTTETPTTKPQSIKYLIDNMIDQLKDDLDNLLKFNENLLHFDSSIVKNAAKTKVEDFFETLSTAIDSQTKVSKDCLENKMENLEAASNILNVTEDISRTLASTLEVGSKTEIKLPNISMMVMKKHLSDNTSSDWEAGDIKVNLPDQPNIAQDDSSVTVSFTSYNNLGSMMNGEDDIRSPVLSVNVVTNHNQNQKRSIPLTKPIEFLLHHKPFKKVRKRKCVYWDFKYSAWSKDGCYTLRKKSTSTSTACQCFHLTNFALTVEQEDGDDDTQDTTQTTIGYYSAVPPITTKPKYGDKIITVEVNTKMSKLEEANNQFKVYRVTPTSNTNINVIKENHNHPKYISEDDTVVSTTESIKFAESKQKLPLLNTRKHISNDYEYYWEEFEQQENNKLLNELPSGVEKVEQYESLKLNNMNH